MKKRLSFVAILAAMVLMVPLAASAGQFTLHPSGFGPHSYASWKAGEGLPDSNGNKSQALYMQKFTTTPTTAAGVVLIKGFEGMPASELTGLAWDHREDGHCGAGAPRWNIGLTLPNGTQTTAFLGCNAAQHTQLAASTNGHGWCMDTQPSAAIPTQGTIRYLAIVFDEGNDTANPPPAGCTQETLTPGGFVFLDNITVQADGVTHTWTSASDNGNGGTTSANTTLTADQLQQQLGFPLVDLLH
ncbi:MAG: hypothetical protein ACJ76P_04470 [Actinomycetota bacterium]